MRAFLILLAMTAVAQCLSQTAHTAAGLYKYTSPSGFKRDDTRVPPGRVGFFAPPKSGYSTNIMITTADVGSMTAEKIGKDTVAYLKQNDRDASQVVGKSLSLGGKPGFSVRSLRRLKNGMSIEQHQVIGVHKAKVVILTFSTPIGMFKSENAKFMNSLKSWAWAK